MVIRPHFIKQVIVYIIISVVSVCKHPFEAVFGLVEQLESDAKWHRVSLLRHFPDFRDAEVLLEQFLSYDVISTFDLGHADHFVIRLEFGEELGVHREVDDDDARVVFVGHGGVQEVHVGVD